MRFEVPQFIEIEDKIFGPLTWRQFIYVAGGFGVALILFLITPFLVFILLGIPVAVLAFLLAFYPINNQPFSRFLESVLIYMRNNKIYLWRKKGSGVYKGADGNGEEGSSPSYMPPSTASNLSSLSRKLELKSIQTQTDQNG